MLQVDDGVHYTPSLVSTASAGNEVLTYYVALNMFCANRHRLSPNTRVDDGTAFQLGPIVSDPAVNNLLSLLNGKTVVR